MQNAIKKFRQSSIVFEKSGILSKKLKTLTSSNYHRVNTFCWNFAHVPFLLSWVICKIKNTLVFHIFINNSRSKENKKNLEHSFVDIVM